MEALLQDVRYALRVLRKSPGFTIVALLIMALGIGANTAIFSLTQAVLLRSLPITQPEQLVLLTFERPGQSLGITGPMFNAIEKRQQVYSSMFAWYSSNLSLKQDGETRQVRGAVVSGETFSTLGLKPVVGRLINPQDDQTGGGSNGWAAVISYDHWQHNFQGDRNVIGKSLQVENIPVTVVGVAPAAFTGVEVGSRPQIFLPLNFETQWHAKSPMLKMQGGLFLTVMGRLKPGAIQAQAVTDLERIKPEVFQEADSTHMLKMFFPDVKLGVTPGRSGRSWMRIQYSVPLLVLQGLVGLVLLICCSNLTMLLLARASSRRHEIAIRSALGAHRWRLVRQLLVESFLVSASGAMIGLWFASSASQALLNALSGSGKLFLDLHPDKVVLLFTAAIAFLTALLSGLLPGLRATRVDVLTDLKESAGASQSGRSMRAEPWLLAGQVGFSVTILIVATLFAGTLYRLLSMDPGYRTAGVVVAPTDFKKLQQNDKDRAELYSRMIERLNSMPGIDGASMEEMSPLTGWSSSMSMVAVGTGNEAGKQGTPFYNAVGPNYFATRGTRILAGRDFSVHDTGTGQMICVVNVSAAKYFFNSENVIGRMLRDNSATKGAVVGDNGKSGPGYEIVGVAEDSKFTSLRNAAPPTVYFPFRQTQTVTASPHFVLRVNNIAAAIASYRQVAKEFVPDAPFLQPITMREQVRESIGLDLTLGMLSGFFAVVALLLTAIGLYGLLAYSVSRRTPEIGIRMALGAQRLHIAKNVLRQAVLPVLAGLVAGTAGAIGAARFVKKLLYGVQPSDPAIYAIAGALILVVAAMAAWLPARRATRVDPMVALRRE